MFDFLKKKENTIKPLKENIVERIKETKMEDLNSFLQTEMDVKLKSLDAEKQGLLDKRNKYFDSGFINSKLVKEIDDELLKIKKINDYKIILSEATEYFNKKYPSYKLIPSKAINILCKEYDFVSVTIDEYTENVSDKILTEIENFKIEEEDFAYTEKVEVRLKYGNVTPLYYFLSRQEYEEIIKDISIRIKEFRSKNYSYYGDVVLSYYKSKLEIVTGKSNVLILQPVIFNNIKLYLIVSEF